MKEIVAFYNAYWRSIFIAVSIFVLTTFTISDLIRGPVFPILGRDKIDHFVVFFILASFLIVDLRVNTNLKQGKLLLLVFVICVVLGGSIELIQHYFMPAREGCRYDMLANTLGCISACYIQPRFKLLRY